MGKTNLSNKIAVKFFAHPTCMHQNHLGEQPTYVQNNKLGLAANFIKAEK